MMIKRYSLCLLVCSFFGASAMEHVDISKIKRDTVFEDIVDKIDRNHLGVSDCVMNLYWHLKPFVSTCLSVLKGRLTTPQQAKKEMDKIESYIPADMGNEKISVLKRLAQYHWYVHYLTQTLIDERVDQLRDVTGSTIDELYDRITEKSSETDIFVDNKAREKTFHTKYFIDRIPRLLEGINFTVFEGPHGDIQPKSLVLSSDGKYLSALDYSNTHLMWDTKTAERVCPQNLGNIKWICGDKVDDVVAQFSKKKKYGISEPRFGYYAVMTRDTTHVNTMYFPAEVARNCKGIVFFKVPEFNEHLCQTAFDNCIHKQDELRALRNSQTFKQLEGFPKTNLSRVIDNRLMTLALVPQYEENAVELAIKKER